jgi:hypothetical protein
LTLEPVTQLKGTLDGLNDKIFFYQSRTLKAKERRNLKSTKLTIISPGGDC